MLLSFLAQSPTPTGGGTSGGSGLGSLVFVALLVAMFYFLMIRPQRRMRQQTQQLQSGLAVGDQVETVAGMYGTIRQIDDTTLLVELAPGMIVKMSRGGVRRKMPGNEETSR